MKRMNLLLGVLLSLALLSGVRWTAYADGSLFQGAGCPVTYAQQAHTHASGTDGENIQFKPWTSTDSLPYEAGSYYLTDDVTLDIPWWVPDGTVNLCLNGKTITQTGSDSVIYIDRDAALNLYDEEAGEGRITGGYATQGGGVYIYRGSFSIYGGSITGNHAGAGGGVYVNEGAFNMYGGAITDNHAGTGGGVYVTGAFVMTDGTISGNSAAEMGAGLFRSAEGMIRLDGGTISDEILLAGDGGNDAPNAL